ncbi:uncharacterized protein F4807DRAFT_455961 [Annulohypoxylon truncatum]|uniref:uncharacterized protein n=1 Tax=Annulohypoxylon truncatum TaxID=327061 RepID=UPI002007AE4F|nr:uncharacterized protein F4807DRAFT_455961 [Annulohypoxylon truncatum]KAI1214320.1 hypothetical protein F4807DRAFT_455961 [Annulohypoxylon truncatum]
MDMNSITPTSGIDLLVRQGIEHLREKTATPGQEGDATGPTSPRSYLSSRSRARSSVYSCFQNDLSEESSVLKPRSRLLELPNELQYMIAAYLNFGDMERLRRTCRHFRALLTRDFVRAHFGGDERFSRQLISHCQSCLKRPGRQSLILQPQPQVQATSNDRPLSSKCFRCAVSSRDLHVGTSLTLANSDSAWVCRWCGWPVRGTASPYEQFHRRCYDRYYRVLWAFLCLGFAQFAAGVVAAALSLIYFRGDRRVFPPVVAGFALLWVCMAFLAFRGNRVRTYHWVGVLELVILGLWIPPVYAVATGVGDGAPERSAIVALVFYGVNVMFRLLNFIGNIVLMYEYDMTKHYVPQLSLRRKLLNMLMAGLIYWTYPQCVEQRYPPDYN